MTYLWTSLYQVHVNYTWTRLDYGRLCVWALHNRAPRHESSSLKHARMLIDSDVCVPTKKQFGKERKKNNHSIQHARNHEQQLLCIH